MAAYTTIDDPEAYFQVQLYTGDGAANNAITLGADTDMQPDLVWIKNRDAADSHCVFDAVRGDTKVIHMDTTAAAATDADTLDSFTSDGFQVDADVKVNTNTENYVSWNWKETATAGFDIVAYTGTGNDATATISHSLSAVPEFIWIKCRTSSKNNITYHGSLGNTYSQYLDETNASSTSYDYWADTSPTSSVFTVKDDGSYDEVNAANDQTFIAYLWSGKQGFSKFGSYTGNGNADGPFVYTGFRPAFIMIKCTNAAQDWFIHDNKRGYNGTDIVLLPNTVDADITDTAVYGLDILSNGFKMRGTHARSNADGNTYIFSAFAEAPLVNSNGVPCNAR